MERIELPAALASALGADLVGPRERESERLLELVIPRDLAADVADDAAEPGAQQAQLTLMAVELPGVGVTAGHHGGLLGDAQIGLPQPHSMAAGQAVEPFDGGMKELGVGREGDVLGLHRGVDRDPRQVLGTQGFCLMGNPQALGEQQLQLGAEPFPPMAQVRALVRERVLEELLAGEVLEIGVVDPAIAHALVGQSEDVLEQKYPNHEPGLDPGPPLLAVERGDLLIDPIPIDLAGERHQLVIHVDDLVEPSAEQIT